MKPAPFDYAAASTLEEALALRSDRAGDCAVLAGGQSLVPALNLRLARPALVLDINGVEELAGIGTDDGGIVIGALTRQRDAERSEAVAERAPLIREALSFVGHPAIRVRGTVGGSLAHADPAAELPAVASVLEAELVVRRPGGERVVSAEAFFTGWFATVIEPDELLTEIRLPALPPGMGTAFEEVARRRGDFALVGAAAALTVRDASVAEMRVAIAGVAGGPVRVREEEREAEGQPAGAETFRAAAAAIAAALDPQSDLHASAAYRRRAAAVVVERALARAGERAAEG